MINARKNSKTMRIDLIPTGSTPDYAKHRVQPGVVGNGGPGGEGVPSLGYREFFQSVYDAGFITDAKGHIRDANRRAIEFFQYSPEDLCRLNAVDVISGADASLLDRIYEHLENEHFALIQAHCIRSDGTIFPAEIAASQIKSSLSLLSFFVRDISVRRQAEEMLYTEHQAIQNAVEGIATTDLHRILTYCNPATATTLGYDRPDALVGASADTLFVDSRTVGHLLDAILVDGEVWQGELEARRRDGSPLPVRVSIACTRDADGETLGMVLSFVDHSDHIRARKAEREAEQQRVMLESLGTACHHLGQPATVMIANLELLNREIKGASAHVQELVTNGLKAGEKLSEILARLRDIREYRPTSYLGDPPRVTSEQARILEIL